MRYMAAYLLAILGGNDPPNSKDLKNILDSVGIKSEEECLIKVIDKLKGKNIEDVIMKGSSKLPASMSLGGAVAVAASAGFAASAAACAAPAAPAKEEKKEESEESDDDGLWSL